MERDRTYASLQDPAVLARCMPGCEQLHKVGEDEYEMKMKMVISSIQGLFSGKIRVSDHNSPESFRLIVEGNGNVGFMKGDGLLTFVADGKSTEIRYQGDVQIGGMVAGVGQRLLDATARFIIRRFFGKFSETVAAAGAQQA